MCSLFLTELVLRMIEKLLLTEEDKAREAMDIFDNLFESEVAIVVPHVRPIVALCLKIAADSEGLEDATRVKAIATLGRIIKLKKKAIVKLKLHTSIIGVLFPIICHFSNEHAIMEEIEMADGNSSATCACQTLDIMALNLPPHRMMAALLSFVQPALEAGNDPQKLRGAFTCLAICAEGCSEYIRTKYLITFLQAIGAGIRHDNELVRYAALHALGDTSCPQSCCHQ